MQRIEETGHAGVAVRPCLALLALLGLLGPHVPLLALDGLLGHLDVHYFDSLDQCNEGRRGIGPGIAGSCIA